MLEIGFSLGAFIKSCGYISVSVQRDSSPLEIGTIRLINADNGVNKQLNKLQESTQFSLIKDIKYVVCGVLAGSCDRSVIDPHSGSNVYM